MTFGWGFGAFQSATTSCYTASTALTSSFCMFTTADETSISFSVSKLR